MNKDKLRSIISKKPKAITHYPANYIKCSSLKKY